MTISYTCLGEGVDSNAIAEAFTTGNSSSSKRTLDEEDIEEEDDTDLDALEAMFSKVNSAIAIEKEVAADCIGDLLVATKSAFIPYIEETMPVLIDLLEHYYEGIRKSAVGSLFSFIKTIYELSNPQEYKPGAAVVSQSCSIGGDADGIPASTVPCGCEETGGSHTTADFRVVEDRRR
jgi:hypothetical protein